MQHWTNDEKLAITVMCIQKKIMCVGLCNVNYNELITSSVQ
jgi:hypothetical protein